MIYVLINGEAKPFDCEELENMLDDGVIEKGVFGCVEGMKEWRSIVEAIIWERAKMLLPIKPFLKTQVRILTENGGNFPPIRKTVIGEMHRCKIISEPYVDEWLDFVIQTNADLLTQYNRFPQNTDLDGVKFYPTWELTCFGAQLLPRDWSEAWAKSGGKMFNNRMVARKDDPVWERLSDFGFPFPPFSFDNSMSVQDVSRVEANEFKINLETPFEIKPITKEFEIVGILET